MGYQGIEKVEHIIFISKYKQKSSSMDRYSLKIYRHNFSLYFNTYNIWPQNLRKSRQWMFLSQPYKLCLNIYSYVSLPFERPASRGCFGLLDNLSAKFESCIMKIKCFVSVSASGFIWIWNSEFQSRIFSQTNKNVECRKSNLQHVQLCFVPRRASR
mgnify:CR=1 FL=1